jgi:hypothetical protein
MQPRLTTDTYTLMLAQRTEANGQPEDTCQRPKHAFVEDVPDALILTEGRSDEGTGIPASARAALGFSAPHTAVALNGFIRANRQSGCRLSSYRTLRTP